MAERKRRLPGAEEGGGHEAAGMMRWLISYADFITLLASIFFVWYAMSSRDVAKFKEFQEAFVGAVGTRAVIEGGDSILPSYGSGPSTIIPPLKPFALQEVGKEIKEQIAGTEGVEVTFDERGLKISLLASQAFFDLGKADLKPKLRAVLQTIAQKLQEGGVKNPIRVEGHTDSLPIATPEFPSNWELSTRRATNVLRFLLQQGIPPGQLSAAGYADTKPVKPNVPGGTPENRRVDIVILHGSEKKNEPR